MNRIQRALSSQANFSQAILQMPLYDYQLRPLKAILDSILQQRGLEFLLLFPRQSGKNEAIAHLEVYLLNLLQRTGGNIVHAAIGDGLGRGLDRLEQRLDNPLNGRSWYKKQKPTRRLLGNAAAVFLSSHPQAHSRGETAHHCLIIDEMQDQQLSHIESVFTPMRVSTNATAVYLGTAKLTTDALWTKKKQLESLEKVDNIKRVFLVQPEKISQENAIYGEFLDNQVLLYGRNHPIVASEYFLEPVDGSGGLFDPRRQALMLGRHKRQLAPGPGKVYVAVIDVGGQDEAATDPLLQLSNPGRDYTVCTIFEVDTSQADAPGPICTAVDVFVDHGNRHFQTAPGKPALADRLNAYLDHWSVAWSIIDKSGVGEGLCDWLAAKRAGRVTGYQLHPINKAALGNNFLAMIETGRFKYWSGDEEQPLSEGWWFWQQVQACQYEVKPDGRFERDLRWGVAENHKVDTPAGLQLTHDDRLLSAALIAVIDDLIREGTIILGAAKSAVIEAENPLEGMEF